MQVIKKINNNVAICTDDNGTDLVAFGKGIGFPKIPYELNDLSLISRTFYQVNSQQLALLNEIPTDVFEVAIDLVEQGSRYLKMNFLSSLVFALADHINFALERTKKGLILPNPMGYEIPRLYPEETSIGKWALRQIYRKTEVLLPESEATNIAMHFINAKDISEKEEMEQKHQDQLVSEVRALLEDFFECTFDPDDFNYIRFVSHLVYLFRRNTGFQRKNADNLKLLENLKEEFPESFEAARKIQKHLYLRHGIRSNEEDVLYLMVHVNRLVSRNQSG